MVDTRKFTAPPRPAATAGGRHRHRDGATPAQFKATALITRHGGNPDVIRVRRAR